MHESVLGSAPAHSRHGPPSATKSTVAQLPPEVPTLPISTVTRPELIATLRKRVLPQASTEMGGNDVNIVVVLTAPPKAEKVTLAGFFTGRLFNAEGMGGIGKTTMAAALARDGEVRTAFDKICWVSVGQHPNTLALQQTLYVQLVSRQMPGAGRADESVAFGLLKAAAKDMSVLLVLDDVWNAAHTTLLNFIVDSTSRSDVVITTRICSLLDGSQLARQHVSSMTCGLLSVEASLELLLRVGRCEHLLAAAALGYRSPPPAALEAVEICGHLPLALGIAGGIIAELADEWESELIPLLKEESDEASAVERVVTASLHVVPRDSILKGIRGAGGAHGQTSNSEPACVKATYELVTREALFALFAVFPEDAVVPVAAVDVLTPLLQSRVGESVSKPQVRRCVQQLLTRNLMRGSVEGSVSVHDLVRDCMIRRAETVREGGLRATQRETVPLLLDVFYAFDARWPAASYASANLHWHVRQAQQPDVAIHTDAVLMSVLTHESGDVRKQGATGIGVDKLSAAADACDWGGEHFEAAQLMWAASAVRGMAAGAELQRAWASFKKLEGAGRGSSASRSLESHVLNQLNFASDGGLVHGSYEHNELTERIRELAADRVNVVNLRC